MSANLSVLPPSSFPPLVPQDFIALLEQLYRDRTLVAYQAGQIIPLHPQELLILHRGIVLLSTIQPDGGETLLGMAGPPMPIGLPLTLVNPYWATAMTDVDVLPLAMVEVEQSPLLMAGLCRHLMLRFQQTEAWLALGGKRLVVDRLRQLLYLIAQEFGQRDTSGETDGVRIPVRLTHHQLASAIGTTRVTVTRLLKEFKAEGWLDTQQRYLVIALDRVPLKYQPRP